MTVKLLLLKSGEDLIADIQEMVVGDEENPRVIGYFLTKPCIVKMRNPNMLTENTDGVQKSGFQVSLYPWMPLSKDEVIPLTIEWVVTMVTPTDKLTEMYMEDVINYGKQNDQSNSTDEQSNSNQSD
jgi:hypothetical protein